MNSAESTCPSSSTSSTSTSSSSSMASSEEGTAATDPDIRKSDSQTRQHQDNPNSGEPVSENDDRHEIDISGYEREEEDLTEIEEEHQGFIRSAKYLSPLDDCELSFLQRSRPVCRKTRLVSCLSSGSTSPGPLSPLLSDDDFGLSSPPSSVASMSRRCSNESACGTGSTAFGGSQTPRVRFKRGCVITEVNLTWAATSYDRAPIDVAESLDIKRCHSFDGSECLPSPIIEIPEGHPIGNNPSMAVYAAPPSPPLPSSPCTAAHASYAYATTFGEHSDHQDEPAKDRDSHLSRSSRSSSESTCSSSVSGSQESGSLPYLTNDDGCYSSTSGSDSDDYLNNLVEAASLKLGQTPTFSSYFDSRSAPPSSSFSVISDSGNHSLEGSFDSPSGGEESEAGIGREVDEQILKTPTVSSSMRKPDDFATIRQWNNASPIVDEANTTPFSLPPPSLSSPSSKSPGTTCTTQARKFRRRRQQEEDLYAACDALGGF